MSFILEALRKSAHARDRHVLPGVIDRPALQSRRSSLSWWLGGFSALLLVNVAILLFVLFRPSTPVNVAAESAPTHAESAVAARAQDPSIRSLTPEIQPQRAMIEPPPTTELRGIEPRRIESPDSIRTVLGKPTPATAPSVTQLPAQATAGLPPLNLELHVFSVEPSQRFVIINGEHLREGSAMKAGAQVEKITPDGVILSYQGARFSLP